SGPEQRMLTIVARANGDPAAVAALMRTAAQRIDPRIVVRMPRTIESVLQQGRIAETRFQTTLFVLFAALGCCLTAVGVYGVIGYWVSGRTQEMGIRLELGATPRRLQGLVLAQAARPLAIGVALGLGGAFVLTRQLQSLLYGITPHDPTTLAGATVLLLLVGLAAAWLPARRASRVDPLVARKAARRPPRSPRRSSVTRSCCTPCRRRGWRGCGARGCPPKRLRTSPWRRWGCPTAAGV